MRQILIIFPLTSPPRQVRNEALQKVAALLRQAKFVTANIGELGSALAARCVDSNKNLSAESLRICGELGGALGPHCRAHLRTVVPGLLSALADSKVPAARGGEGVTEGGETHDGECW